MTSHPKFKLILRPRASHASETYIQVTVRSFAQQENRESNPSDTSRYLRIEEEENMAPIIASIPNSASLAVERKVRRSLERDFVSVMNFGSVDLGWSECSQEQARERARDATDVNMTNLASTISVAGKRSGILSHLKNILHPFRSSERSGVRSPKVDSKSGRLSASKIALKIKDLKFLELVAGIDPVVDIIAIHGFDGHRVNTWVADNGTLWLRDLLPSEFPNARILAYGYDADSRSGQWASTQAVQQHALGLAGALLHRRKDVPYRPIIFLVHGLGGIILKRALAIYLCRGLPLVLDLQDPLVSTHAILFFGTPTTVAEGATLLQVMKQLGLAYRETTNIIPKDIQVYSSDPEDIEGLYYISREKINSVYFCEGYVTTDMQNDKRVIVPYHPANISGGCCATTVTLLIATKRFGRVIFVDASSQAQLEADLERSIRSLAPQYSKMTWKDAIAYLDGKEQRWLLFLDGADSPNLDLHPYLPTSTSGTILITTRNSECTRYAPGSAIYVGGLEENKAVGLLHTTAGISPATSANSLEIMRELGALALAIIQAGAYIRETGHLDTYLDTFQKHRDYLLRNRPNMSTECTSSTYIAFDLSFHQLPVRAQRFMKLCAFLHPSPIPITLFKQSSTSGFATHTFQDTSIPPEIEGTPISMLQEIFGAKWDNVAFQQIVESVIYQRFPRCGRGSRLYEYGEPTLTRCDSTIGTV
ncbi:hypothetical protein PIIN_10291 [Serendipita indica DSM 11827]|uniref:Uncharacterized protein n=1 Tax=Serendipita indica (strain DSM 11827) TaxID=1109443 RepID=G4TYA3_SERID|nr:hypothetical protein PIIN_10291 [Serendipita indica DSM 11827]